MEDQAPLDRRSRQWIYVAPAAVSRYDSPRVLVCGAHSSLAEVDSGTTGCCSSLTVDPGNTPSRSRLSAFPSASVHAWISASLWVPETTHTARDLRVRPRQGARHDPLTALRLIYEVFTTLLDWIVLRARSDTTKDIEILILRQQLAVLQRRTAAHG